MNPSLWENSRALAVCMKDQSHKGLKLRGLGSWCTTREMWMRARWARAPRSWNGRDGCEGQPEWFSKIWWMSENEGRWGRPKYFRALELSDREGWSNVVTTVHGLWQLKKSLSTVLKLPWQARGAYVGPSLCVAPAVLLEATAASLTYPDRVIFGCFRVRLPLHTGGQVGFSGLYLWMNPPPCTWQDEKPSVRLHYNKHPTTCLSGITNLHPREDDSVCKDSRSLVQGLVKGSHQGSQVFQFWVNQWFIPIQLFDINDIHVTWNKGTILGPWGDCDSKQVDKCSSFGGFLSLAFFLAFYIFQFGLCDCELLRTICCQPHFAYACLLPGPASISVATSGLHTIRTSRLSLY